MAISRRATYLKANIAIPSSGSARRSGSDLRSSTALPQRPHDQLIPRPLGLDVLARKRFTWNNEDFSLWRITGKDRYWESGIKKAYALLATQNEYGGWWEGIEFYNLPPRHHHMYDTYIAGLFLLEAHDLTGHAPFIDAAQRAKTFWLSQPPPANGHTEEGEDAWWYRWGGYVNEFGHTDERLVLNTHAGATEFLALLYERTGDDEARVGMERGVNAFKLGLERGIQKSSGQFLYCLSQADPTLERPGDPPYLRLDLVPQIEDVYTVASSYRLMLANRVARDPEITAAVRRALNYWWGGYREGKVYTYRAYAVIAFAVAAGGSTSSTPSRSRSCSRTPTTSRRFSVASRASSRPPAARASPSKRRRSSSRSSCGDVQASSCSRSSTSNTRVAGSRSRSRSLRAPPSR